MSTGLLANIIATKNKKKRNESLSLMNQKPLVLISMLILSFLCSSCSPRADGNSTLSPERKDRSYFGLFPSGRGGRWAWTGGTAGTQAQARRSRLPEGNSHTALFVEVTLAHPAGTGAGSFSGELR